MADLITKITLSNGKVVQIPVFYKSSVPTVKRKSGGFLWVSHYDNNNNLIIDHAPYTANELCELGNIIYNKSNTTFTFPTPSTSNTQNSYFVSYIAWVEESNSFKLYNQIAVYPSYTSIQYTQYGGNYDHFNYYDDICVGNSPSFPQNPYPDWDDAVDHYASLSQPICNVLSGSYYSMECMNTDSWAYMGWGNAINAATLTANIEAYIANHPEVSVGTDDTENPFGLETSTTGGGDGDNDPSAIDQTDNVDIPGIPNIAIANNGFITIYNPTAGQLNALSQFLWSSAFDIDSFKKLFADPMQCIIGLGIVPVNPTLGGTGTVHFGDIDTHVAMPYLSTQFVQKSMGSVSIEKYVGCFMDYQPYTQIEIYLPYIGTRPLNPDDIMGDSINLTYNIDCLTGGCCAIISSSSKGVLYQFNGSCIANVPVTSINYSSAIQNAVSAIGSIATVGVGAATGAAPIAAMGVAGLAANAANAAVNSKPSVQRSGQMGGSAGLMSVQTPYLIITRPNMSVPNNLNKFTGNTANITMNLNSCKGFTMIDQIHLDGIACTDDEKAELMSILQKGVIF